MMRVLASFAVGGMLLILVVMPMSAQEIAEVTLSNRDGDAISRLTDGNLIRLTIELPKPVDEETVLSFYLDEDTHHLVDCQIPTGDRRCTTAAIGTLGWYWDENEQLKPERNLYVINYEATGWQPIASMNITVHPRPVVMVHGFGANYTTWDTYLGPTGFLAMVGLHGYAVGDGQVTGTLYTGNLLNPRLTTNTVDQNAAALAEYIANVKKETGAEQVDLLGHSRGGLISRYYIDRLMTQRDVAQLIMLGTPNGGSNCALLTGSLQFYQPAALELGTDYVSHVFNPQITDHQDVPFFLIAGTPIQRRILSPCSGTPHDLVVALESAGAISLDADIVEVPILHIDLNSSAELFSEHVAPLLRKSGEELASQGEQPSLRIEPGNDSVQFSQIYTGMVTSDEGNEHIINIDNNVAVASFGLFDPTRSLTVTVRGASGNVITLTEERNGLTILDDPASLIYLGYGFENPNPGPWRVTVRPTQETPPLGAEYAIMAQYQGGATLEATLSTHLPGVGENVEVTATLKLGEQALPVDSAQVVVHYPDGHSESLSISESDLGIEASWQPEQPGIYGIDVNIRSVLAGGIVVERTRYLALQAFETPPLRR